MNGLPQARLGALLERGGANFDPVTWHYLQSLSQRMQAHSGETQALLRQKLGRALDEFEARLTSTQALRPGILPGDLASPPPSVLGQWLQDMQARSQRHRAGARTAQLAQRLGRMALQKKVRQAIAQAPRNAGPLNSHHLVLRALALMQAISPAYVQHLLVQIQTLQVLQQATPGRSGEARSTSSKGRRARPNP